MKFKLFKLNINVEVDPGAPPIVGQRYYHKERDPKDLIAYVVPANVGRRSLTYIKHYKDGTDPAMDSCTIQEFNKYFRKG